MWVYVFGHELTHAVWTWLMGGKVKKFKASANGGHVVVNKSNFAIALAPYFFPLYAVLVVLVFLVGHWLWNWHHYLVWFHLLLGAAYAFHVTLNWHILKHQPNGYQRAGVSLLGRDYLPGQRGRVVGGHPAAGVEGGRADRARLVAAVHRRDCCSAWGGYGEPAVPDFHPALCAASSLWRKLELKVVPGASVARAGLKIRLQIPRRFRIVVDGARSH